MQDLTTTFLGMRLVNPTILASGIVGVTTSSLRYAVENGAGAVTIKSITKEERKGHPQPIAYTYKGGMINAVGYSNPGYKAALEEFSDLKKVGAPVIGSIVAKDAKEFAMLTKDFVSQLDFDAIELPLSCPHTPGFGTLAGQSTPDATHKITGAVRKYTNLPLIIKLSPNVQSVVELAKAAEEAGADAICAVNTMGPGMLIDTATRKRVLGFGMGGVSGDALLPIAMRCVYEIFEATDVPIIGTGGISTGDQAVQMMLAGASAVGVGTAVATRGIKVFKSISDEIGVYMKEHNIKKVCDLIGGAHV